MENEETKQETTASTTSNKKGSSGTIIGVIVIVVILLIAGYFYESHAKQKAETAMAPEAKTSMAPTQAMMAKSMYKDGTYSAEGDYITHVGQKHIKVTITLKNDIITFANVVNEADDPMSMHFQDSFISGYKPMVVGKDISDVHLGKVARSSLTPNGFNSALKLIEQEAKS
jgi:uncharacterized protein with FMN-binding domain